jgi:uncharacterized protein YcfJ
MNMKQINQTVLGIGLGLVLGAGAVSAQDVYVFPAKGQSAEQTEKDKFDCYQWAKQQTGFDPVQGSTQVAAAPAQPAQPAQPAKPGGEVVRGAARGAAVGAVVGEIANDDAGKGAAAGAAGGALMGGFKRRDKKQQQAQQQQNQQQQQQQQAQAAASQKLDSYNRAYKACLEGKGYSVK